MVKNVVIILLAILTLTLTVMNLWFWQLGGSLINLISGLLNAIATIVLIAIFGERFKK